MALSLTEVIALRRLARVYRRILMLAVPAALAGCQDGGDALAPEPADAAGEVSAAVTDAVSSALSLDRIVFASEVAEEEADLWTMNSNGGGVTHLTSFAGSEMHPVWSPDHKRVAFQRARSGKLDVFLMNADGTNKHWALPTASTYSLTTPSWSPDGSNLLVQIQPTPSTSYVGKIDLATGKLLVLAPANSYNRPGRYPIYSKDGKWIYYMAGGAPSQVRRFQPYGGDYYVNGYPGNVGDLALSPDGTKIAFDMNYEGINREILVLDLAAHHTTRLTTTTASSDEIHPAWSPDGTLLAFVSDRSGKWQIYTMNSSTGGNVHKLTNKANGAFDPSWYR
jgi:Tol biopolymer transport system component